MISLRGSSRIRPRATWLAAVVVALAVWPPPLAAVPAETPLSPPDTSSPRATLESFIDGVTEAFQRYLGQDVRTRSEFKTTDSLQRAVRTLNLSAVPPELVQDVGIESALLLKEVIDRIGLPPAAEIPAAGKDAPDKWVLPGTEIAITKVTKGPRAGEYLFSPDTVQRAHEYFERVKHLPYRSGASERIYKLYVYAPGWMIPGRLVNSLPRWLLRGYGEQAVWQWFALGLTLLVGGSLIAVAFVWPRRRAPGPSHLQPSRLLFPVTGMLVVKTIDYLIDQQINIAGDTLNVAKILLEVTFFGFVAVFIVALSSLVGDIVASSHRLRPKSIDMHLLRVSLRIAMIALITLVILHVTSSVGVPLTPVLAGLGVGGLAVALAAQSTIENVIGGLTLFADRPVRVGDLCQFGDTVGFVEEIGLRSTRIRTLERTVITVPNGEFSKLPIENLYKRDRMLLRTTLGLRYETTPEQLRFVLAKLREMLLAHPKILDEPLWVRFANFGAYSLDIELFAYVRSSSRLEFFGIREDVYLRIIDLVEQAGTGFALPSQTHYVAQDAGLDRQATLAAEAEVRAWRSGRTLPFPDPSEATRRGIRGTLDFPPAGSPDGPPADDAVVAARPSGPGERAAAPKAAAAHRGD